MIPCAWPGGCAEWTYGDERLCAYHSKLADGLIVPPQSRIALDGARKRELQKQKRLNERVERTRLGPQ